MSNYAPSASSTPLPPTITRQILDHELLHTMQDFHFRAFSSWQATMPNPVGMFVRVPYEFYPTVLGDPLLKGPLIGGVLYGSWRLNNYVENVFYDGSGSL